MRAARIGGGVVVVAAIGIAAIGMAQHEGSPAPVAQPEEPISLHDRMEHMNDAARALAKAMSSPAPEAAEEALKQLAEFQEHVLGAKLLEPKMIQDKGESERAAGRADFRRQLAGALKVSAEIEMLLLEGKREEARAKYGELLGIKKQGHDVYKGVW